MKCTVDSKEFAAKIKAASRYSGSSASQVSECALLTVTDAGLFINTTNFTESCRAFVNVNPTEERETGSVVMLTDRLVHLAEDSGDPLTIRETDKYLVLEYGEFKPRLLKMAIGTNEFPVWIAPTEVARVPSRLLSAAVAATDRDEFARPVCRAVHVFPQDDKIAIIGVNGYIGARFLIGGKVEDHVALESRMLSTALPLFGNDMVSIGLDGQHIELAAGAVALSFPSINIEPADGTDALSMVTKLGAAVFDREISDGPITISGDDLDRIIHRTRQSRGVDERSEIMISGGMEAEFRGDGFNAPPIHFEAEGELKRPIAFWCRTLVSCLDSIPKGKEYQVSIVSDESGITSFMYVDGEISRFVMPRTTAGYFSEEVGLS